MLRVEYQCDKCEEKSTHLYQYKPAILSRKEHGWAWVKVMDVDGGRQELLCPNCTTEHDKIVRDGK